MATQQQKTPIENKSRDKVTYPLGKINFIMMAVCLLLIIIGFALMGGSANVGKSSTTTCLRAAASPRAPSLHSWDLSSWHLPSFTARKTIPRAPNQQNKIR